MHLYRRASSAADNTSKSNHILKITTSTGTVYVSDIPPHAEYEIFRYTPKHTTLLRFSAYRRILNYALAIEVAWRLVNYGRDSKTVLREGSKVLGYADTSAVWNALFSHDREMTLTDMDGNTSTVNIENATSVSDVADVEE